MREIEKINEYFENLKDCIKEFYLNTSEELYNLCKAQHGHISEPVDDVVIKALSRLSIKELEKIEYLGDYANGVITYYFEIK